MQKEEVVQLAYKLKYVFIIHVMKRQVQISLGMGKTLVLFHIYAWKNRKEDDWVWLLYIFKIAKVLFLYPAFVQLHSLTEMTDLCLTDLDLDLECSIKWHNFWLGSAILYGNICSWWIDGRKYIQVAYIVQMRFCLINCYNDNWPTYCLFLSILSLMMHLNCTGLLFPT